jgi:hypothetical protein
MGFEPTTFCMASRSKESRWIASTAVKSLGQAQNGVVDETRTNLKIRQRVPQLYPGARRQRVDYESAALTS